MMTQEPGPAKQQDYAKYQGPAKQKDPAAMTRKVNIDQGYLIIAMTDDTR